MSTEKTITLTEIAETSICVSSEDGEKVYQKICELLPLTNKVIISFKGVEDLTSAFLNTAIGQLYESFSEEELKNKLKVDHNTSQENLRLLKRVVERAKEYYRDRKPFEEAAQEIMNDEKVND